MRAEQVTVQQPAAVGAAVLVLCASVREHLLGDWLPVDVLDYDIAGFPESVSFHPHRSLASFLFFSTNLAQAGQSQHLLPADFRCRQPFGLIFALIS